MVKKQKQERKKRKSRWSGDAWLDDNDNQPVKVVNERVRHKPTKVDIVYEHLLNRKLYSTKEKICADLGMSRSGVNRACKILRKEKKIIMHRRKYWGVNQQFGGEK